jgi:hypothetical protein
MHGLEPIEEASRQPWLPAHGRYRFNIRLSIGTTNGVGTWREAPSANRTCGPPGTTDA